MLNYVSDWCKKWRLVVSKTKTKVVHFRKCRSRKSSFVFMLGDDVIDYVSDYKYLGFLMNEHLNNNSGVDVLSKSAGRALGGLINKFRYIKGMGFKTYSTIFETCVNPIMTYAAEIWGFKDYSNLESVQCRAMKYYLGVHKYAPNVAVQGDCGLLKCKYVQWLAMCRFWNRLHSMDQNRLTYKI